MAEGTVRFEIGFTGGGATAGQAPADAVKALEEAVETGQDRLLVLEHEGTRLLVRTGQVSWLRVHGGGKRIGF